MRTTLDIDEDILGAAREEARRTRRSIGEVLSGWARRALVAEEPRVMAAEGESIYGFRPIPPGGKLVTNELVEALREQEGI
jgi:hypothetical protein